MATSRIGVAAFKGGAGKTTVATNLAAAIAELGPRVLLVDADPQGAAGNFLGADVAKPTLYETLHGTPAAAAVRPTAVAGLDLIPADLDLAAADLELGSLNGWQKLMRRHLDEVASDYDVLLVDVGPGLTPLTHTALHAVDSVLLVARPRYGDLRGLNYGLDVVARAGRRTLGVLPNMVGRRTVHQQAVLDEIAKVAGDRLLPAIPERVAVPDAQAGGQPLIVYEPSSDVAEAFRVAAKEVVRRAQTRT